MNVNTKEIEKSIINAQLQCNNRLAHSEGCLDGLEKLLTELEKLAGDADELSMDCVRETIMAMRSEVTKGQARFKHQAEGLAAMQKLLLGNPLKDAIAQLMRNKASEKSSLILPAHYRR